MLNNVDNCQSSTAGRHYTYFPLPLTNRSLHRPHEPPETAHNEERHCRLIHLLCHDRRLLLKRHGAEVRSVIAVIFVQLRLSALRL